MSSEASTNPTKLPAKYRPADHEPAVRERWERSRAFHAVAERVLSGERPPYCIFIPPPNVTARLHLGHALNNTIQDVLSRAHRMKGFEVLWMPGTDHAGIATQTVVEQRLLKEEGKRRADFAKEPGGREKFVARVQAWKDEYEAAITDQLRQMGCSCDWDRQRFTMDEVCARAVREAFFRLFRDGLIYRGKRLVNWDPATQTALADDEVEMEEIDGTFYYLRYPLVRASGASHVPVTWSELGALGYPGAGKHPGDERAWVTVATTRPETYLGDTAVAINPQDPRAGALRGMHVQLPLVGRVIPIVEDDYVVRPLSAEEIEAAEKAGTPIDPKAKFATGFLKVTPAHDPNDWEIGQRHKLAIINVMAPDASISDKHGWTDVGDAHLFVGLSREDARKKVVGEFKARGLLEQVKPYRHSVGHSYRSHVPIEPYLSDQWYCKVTDDRLRGAAVRAMTESQRGSHRGAKPSSHAATDGDGAMTFFPERYAKPYEAWHENLRDWCISRQLWWGHRIPVWRGLPIKSGSPALNELANYLQPFVSQGRAHLITPLESTGLQVKDQINYPFSVAIRDPYGADRDLRIELEQGWKFQQDPDVLDTWFSSALWPISTLGWPDPPAEMKGLLEAFNPSSVLSTAREIITLWVSRMVMFNRYLLPEVESAAPGKSNNARPTAARDYTAPDSSGRGDGPVPFRHVYIHAVVQDGHGQRMSKSLGNGVDPLDIVHSHGTDALRFILAQTATGTQDVRLPVDLSCPHCNHAFEPAWITSPAGYKVAAPHQTCPSCKKKCVSAYGVSSGSVKATADEPQARNSSTKFDAGRNFCTKLWNATKFTLMNLEGGEGAPHATPTGGERPRTLIDRWMLSRVARTTAAIDDALAGYQFAAYTSAVYDLFWRDFCDWYLEAIKPTVRHDAGQRAVLRAAMDSILRLLHPLCPYVTETLWDALRELPAPAVHGLTLADGDLLCVAGWPVAHGSLIDEKAEREFERVRTLVEAVREVRASKGVEPRRRPTLHVPAELARACESAGGLVETMAQLGKITTDAPPAGGTAAVLVEGLELVLSDLADEADPAAERENLSQTIARLDKEIATLDGRLSNPGYAAKAPAKLVEETKQTLAQKRREREAAAARLAQLG